MTIVNETTPVVELRYLLSTPRGRMARFYRIPCLFKVGRAQVCWSKDGQHLNVLILNASDQRLHLHRIDTRSGKCKQVRSCLMKEMDDDTHATLDLTDIQTLDDGFVSLIFEGLKVQLVPVDSLAGPGFDPASDSGLKTFTIINVPYQNQNIY